MSASNWLTLEEAISSLLQYATAVEQSERCDIPAALGRILAEDITAPIDVPGQAVSAMDGYAVPAASLRNNITLKVVHTILAGDDVSTLQIQHGEAARIMTGAGIPQGADAVVMQENTQRSDNTVMLITAPEINDNIRPQGNDVCQGEVVIRQGTRLQASHLMLLASLGLTDCLVKRKLRVAIMATGDELQQAGSPLAPGQLYNSNSVGIAALLRPYDVDIIDLGIVRDDPDQLAHTFTQAAATADLIISSGGVSVGDADYVKSVLDSLGDIGFWKVAIKPGKPFAFGQLNNCLFCGVPGNPVSAYVTTQQLVLPLIGALQGDTSAPQQLQFRAIVQSAVRHRPGRVEYVRAVLSQDEDSQWLVAPLPRQSSGVMTTVTQANCYIVVAADSADVVAGTTVMVQPFSHLISHPGMRSTPPL